MKADKRLYAVAIEVILCLEGQGDYIRVHLKDKKLMVHDTLKKLILCLPEHDFMRIHRSWAVNLQHIQYIEGNQVRVGDSFLPCSPAYRDELLTRYSG